MKKIAGKILIGIFIILATILVIFYAKGYRINFTDNTLIQTGILHLETQPNRANFYLTEDFRGKAPRIVTSLPADKYTLDIWLADYHSVGYNVEIFPERSTPIDVFLFKKEPEERIISTIEEPILEIHVDNSRSNAFILVEKSVDEQYKNYEILRFQTNTRFWQLGENPSTLFTFSIGLENIIEEISFSPNGKNFLLEISGEENLTELEIIPKGKHIISLDTLTILADIEEIEEDIKWSHDGESIVWQDEEGIKKINLKEAKIPVLVYEPNNDTGIIFFDSYTNGEIYVLYEKNDNLFATLSKTSVEQGETILIEEIYYQNEERFLDNWKELEAINYQPFTNSPQSTLFVGQPIDFLISKEYQTIFFNTEFASYLYDIEENNYILINPYQTEILGFSPDNQKIYFLSLETEQLGYFIFEKEKSNHSIELGGGYIENHINKEICSDFAWHQNSQNIYYVCENSLYTGYIQTEKNINIIEDFGNTILLENNAKVITFSKENGSTNIVEFIIN